MVKGIPQIQIPIRKEDLTMAKVEPYLTYITNLFAPIKAQIRKDYDKYLLDHDILLKERPFEDDANINNIIKVPNLNAAVDWKVGYEFGNPITYAQSKLAETDDMDYFNQYLRCEHKSAIDTEVATWVFATGIGFYFCDPKSSDYDPEEEAPFNIYCRDADTCFKVYSSYGKKAELFDVLCTSIEEVAENGTKTVYNILDIYFPKKVYTYKAKDNSNAFYLEKIQDRGLYQKLPLTEKRRLKDGIGIVAIGNDMQNGIDKIMSSGLDSIEESANEIYVYENVSLGKTADEQKANHTSMKQNGAIVINSNDPNLPAKLNTIAPKSKLDELMKVYHDLNVAFHNTIGYPMEASDTNSGGTTKSGSEVSNGYDNAFNRAIEETTYFQKADRELLNKLIWICKNDAKSQINEIKPSEIEIKYSLNLTDNMLTKSQSFTNLIQYMPADMALRLTRMSNQPETDGKKIENCFAYKAFFATKLGDKEINEGKPLDE